MSNAFPRQIKLRI